MLQWWLDLPAWLRMGISLIFLIAGAAIVLYGVLTPQEKMLPRERDEIIIGFMCVGVGLALLIAGGKSDAEKNGYKF
jgi:hypothetical protein